MPNIIRNVTRSTLIQQYFKHCEEEEVEPLSRATLFRVLEVREASERKSLQGIDNIAAEGSNAFEKLRKIVIAMEGLGVTKSWVESTLRKLNNAILYLRTDYSVHCKEQSPCPDHCNLASQCLLLPHGATAKTLVPSGHVNPQILGVIRIAASLPFREEW